MFKAQSIKNKAQSIKHKEGIAEGDGFVKCLKHKV